MVVDVYQNYSHYQHSSSRSVEDTKTGKVISGRPVDHLQRLGGTSKRGTTVSFQPDSRVFEDVEFSGEIWSRRRLRELAYLERRRACLSSSTNAVKDKDARRVELQLRRRAHGLCAVSSTRTKTPMHTPPSPLKAKRDDTLRAGGHSIHGFLHRKRIFLCQQHAHRRRRHPRDWALNPP